LIKGNKIEEFLRKRLNNITFDKLKIPTYITAFDIEKKREVVYTKGDVTQAVRASISIPGIFIPIENNNEIIVDAGIVDPVPTEVLKKNGAELIIAVNVTSFKDKPPLYAQEAKKQKLNKKMPTMIEATMKSLSIMGSEIAHADLKDPNIDFIIDVYLDGVDLFDYKKAKLIIKKGEKTAQRRLKEIKSLAEPHTFKDFLNELGVEFGLKGLVQKMKETMEVKDEKVQSNSL
jgi:NTE family protein